MCYAGYMQHAHNLIGGRICLDFCNTFSGDDRVAGNDQWSSYDDLIAWGLVAELFGSTEAERLRHEAASDPKSARRALASARRLREAMYRAFRAEARGEGAPVTDLDVINAVLVQGTSQRRLRPAMQGACWAWSDAPGSLDALLWPVAWSAGELLTSSQLERVKQCGGCPWLFLDSSRNRSRRWCDMRDCGNIAKVRRHRASR